MNEAVWRSQWLIALLGGVFLLGVIFIFARFDDTDSAVTGFEQAYRCEETVTPEAFEANANPTLLDPASSIASGCWQPVTLPDAQAAQLFTLDTRRSRISRVWYRFNYTLPDTLEPRQRHTVYSPRLNGRAWHLWVEGRLAGDSQNEWGNSWIKPLSVTFSAAEFSPGQVITLDIALLKSDAEGFALGRIWVGDARALNNLRAWRDYLQVTLPQASSAVMFLLGAFFLAFWLARRADVEYLLLAFASGIWCVYNLKYALAKPDDPRLGALYDALINDMPIPWLIWSIYLFAAAFAERRLLMFERGLKLYAISATLAALPLLANLHNYHLLLAGIYTLVGIITIGVVVWQAIVNKSIELRVIAAVLLVCAFAGPNDLAITGNYGNPERLYLIPFCGILVFAACFYALQRRYVAAINSQEQLADTLTEKLEARGAELNAYHVRLRQLERIQTLSDERERLMYDMHDGLGSSLLSALVSIEHREVQQAEVIEVLRGCMDDLRLVIDSLEPVEHDLVTLLATIRYRMGERLAATGIRLQWDVQDLPALPWLEPPDALQILRLVQETFNNILKHAKANRIDVATRDCGHEVEITISDNGSGFDSDQVEEGRGLRSQYKRAQQLGGELTILSAPGAGTRLCLRLPVRRNR